VASLSDVREKLARATWLLIIGTGAIQERLKSAYIAVNTLQPDDFPDPGSRGVWQDISRMLASPPSADECPSPATVRGMSDLRASEIAGEFFELSEKVRRFQEFQEWMQRSDSAEQFRQTRPKNPTS
jgi:hypothetical protein